MTTLVFDAPTLNLFIVTGDPTHRHRANGTLTGFTAVFVMAAFSMMGVQNHFSIAVEWTSISLLAAVTYVYVSVYGYVRAIVASGSDVGLGNLRLVSGTSLYIAEVLGSILVGFGYVVGLHLTAAAMLVLLAFTISGAWLLIVGITEK